VAQVLALVRRAISLSPQSTATTALPAHAHQARGITAAALHASDAIGFDPEPAWSHRRRTRSWPRVARVPPRELRRGHSPPSSHASEGATPMKPRASNTARASARRRRAAGKPRRVQTQERPPQGSRVPDESVCSHEQKVHLQTMRGLRVCIGLLAALLLASVAHAVTDGLTPELALGLALTTLLLLAALGLWRVGSRGSSHDRTPPTLRR
jgi:hypothetical protein